MGVVVGCQPSWDVTTSPWCLTFLFAYKKKMNMQTSKQLSNISDLHVTLYDFLAKKSKFKLNPNTKKI